jgi:AmiR/NasT family two-component response regulator
MKAPKKKRSVQARLSAEAYQIIRREAYRRHKPMVEIIDEILVDARRM